jgi:hypothetical protein
MFRTIATVSIVCAAGLSGLAAEPVVMKFLDFNDANAPVNKDGAGYPNQYAPDGTAKVALDDKDAVSGRSIRFEVTKGVFYAQFNAHNPDGSRGFAREYVRQPDRWKFNTFNRLSFWVQSPTNGRPLRSGGQQNMDVGTYVKRVEGADAHSDETGGGHWYHMLNIASTGTWTKVIINMHPHHLRGQSGGTEQRNQPHPTREKDYNYFDSLTRFYVSAEGRPLDSYPAVYGLDEFEFHQEASPENDEQVYGIAATYVPVENRLILTWSRPKDDDTTRHEVRYAFSDIHDLGWDKAAPAPGGTIKPPGVGGYNGMVYATTELPLTGKTEVYLAIRPDNAKLFSQVRLPQLRPGRTATTVAR